MTRIIRHSVVVIIFAIGFLTIVGTGPPSGGGGGEDTEINSNNFDIFLTNALVISRLPIEAYVFGPKISHEADTPCDEGSKTILFTGSSYQVFYLNCRIGDILWDFSIEKPANDNAGLVIFGDEPSSSDFSASLFDSISISPYLQNGDSIAFLGQLDFVNSTGIPSELFLAEDRLEVTTSTNSQKSSHTLTNYQDVSRLDILPDPNLKTISLAGKIESSLMTTLDYKTTSIFKKTTDNYPYEGEFRIVSSKDFSRARIIAYSDAETIQLDLDKNGDGIYDESRIATWTSLINLVHESLGLERYLYHWK